MTDPVDPIQKAVDDYLLMEAKARAWDALRKEIAEYYELGLSMSPQTMDELLKDHLF